jgi:hypothetical protein
MHIISFLFPSLDVSQGVATSHDPLSECLKHSSAWKLPKRAILTRNSQVFGTAAVTIIGDCPTPTNYTKNQVTILSNIAASIPMSIGTNGVLGITWRNINFVKSATGTAA